jgi:enamine deaminase RidA (YjgF/YER057c/UK114 family)
VIERINVPGLKDWGAHNCHVVRAGQHVWVSGVVGMTAEGEVPTETAAQLDLALGILDSCLKAAEAGPEHVVKVTLYMTDASERALTLPRRVAYFGANPPAATLVQVAALVDPRFKVEIDCEAYVP